MDGWLEVFPPLEVNVATSNRTTEGLRCWNLCSMAATNNSTWDTRECERLLVRFQDLEETERFDMALLQCRLWQAEREKEAIAAREAALAQIARASQRISRMTGLESPISPRSSSLGQPSLPKTQPQTFTTSQPHPPQPSSTWSTRLQDLHAAQYNATARSSAVSSAFQDYHGPPFPSQTPARSSEPLMTSALYDPTLAQSTFPIPRHHSMPQEAATGHLPELGTERRTMEVHADSMPMQELPVSSFWRWGGRRHERF
jgi:hypothetical protein